MSGRPSRERFVAPAYPIVAIGGTLVLAFVFALSLSNALEIGALADASYGGFKDNVIEQSASLSRVIFAAYRVLGFRSERGEAESAALERKLSLYASLLDHASYVSKGGLESARELLADDPLMLADRIEASDRDYEAKLAALRAELDRARASPSAALRDAALDRFDALTDELTRILETRSSILVQLDDYVYSAARDRIGHMLEHSRRFLLYFGALALAVGAATALYLRSMSRALAELSRHRNHLGELVDQRTAELSVANDSLHAQIEERGKVEALLRAALKAKELLIKEVHHRVKNNLSILKSLIELQKSYAKDDGALEDLQSRLDAVAIIHEKLYRSADLSSIDFAEYLRDLASSLVHTLRDDPDSIRIDFESPTIMMTADTLVTLGLVATEIITNALKHGFAARRRGSISIRAEYSERGLTLAIGDDGDPPASAAQLFEGNSLGTLLIRELCAQLRGTMDVAIDGGTKYLFRFPDLSSPDPAAAS